MFCKIVNVIEFQNYEKSICSFHSFENFDIFKKFANSEKFACFKNFTILINL